MFMPSLLTKPIVRHHRSRVSPIQLRAFSLVSTIFSLSMEMSRLTRDGTAEPVSRDQILRHARGQGNIRFPCSADHEQDWQPYPVDPYSAICDDYTHIHTYTWLPIPYVRGLLDRKISEEHLQSSNESMKK